MPDPSSTNDRLDSWKEIAAYLKRNERTVSRWEKRGLPVYRVPGGRKQAIFAFKHELDAWLRLGGVPNGEPEESPVLSDADSDLDVVHSVPEAGAGAHPAKDMQEISLPILKGVSKRSARKKWTVFAGGVLGFAAAIIGVFIFAHKAPVARIARIQKITHDGRPKTNLRSSGKVLYYNDVASNWQIVSIAPEEGLTQTLDTPFPNVELQDVANDGQNLLITSFGGAVEKGGRPLWIMTAKGGEPHRVKDRFCDYARWSPDNRKIACVDQFSILLFDNDGSNVQNLGSFGSLPLGLLWSPKGDSLRFVIMDPIARTQTAWEVRISGEGGTVATSSSKLALGKDCCVAWMWTPDGKDFLYTRIQDSSIHPKLFIRLDHDSNADQSELLVALSDVGALAPGGTNHEFYALMGDAYPGQLFRFNSKSDSFQIYLPGLSADCLSFSRDGQWMTYVTLPDQSLWRSRIDGTEATRLTNQPMEAEFSAWSPDGRQIAFMGKQMGKPWRIFIISRDGGAMKEAANGDDGQGAPTWSADGKSLAYGNISCEETHSCWIRQIDIATGKEEILPGSSGFRSARWSPDGKWILALQPQTHQLLLSDLKNQHWQVLADSITGDNPNWSRDSQYVYVETIKDKLPVIERVRIKDGYRETVADLTSLQKSSGQLDYWIGLTPDNSPILLHQFTTADVYALEWAVQ
jgi:Tol biopolymer transport system component